MNSNDPTERKTKKGVGWKMRNMWKRLFPDKKRDKVCTVDELNPEENKFQCASCTAKEKLPALTNFEGDLNIIDQDKDRIRTSCKLSLQDLPEFPTREEVKQKIEAAHKYYGIKCVHNYYVSRDNAGEKQQEPLPSWYYILERPLVEQYVLMNNYIRKLSVLGALKKDTEVEEEPPIEEEESSISSLSDYSDFADGSEVADLYQRSKKNKSNTASNGNRRRGTRTVECSGDVRLSRTEVSTITTKDYEIVIRDPNPKRGSCFTSTTSGDDITETVQGAEPTTSDLEDEEDWGINQLNRMTKEGLCSGDHLPNMKDFDLSSNLRECPTLAPLRAGQTYYQWEGNTCPTKTPLLNTDTRPIHRRSPNSPMDFWSFRNLSLSPEYLDMCRRNTECPAVQKKLHNDSGMKCITSQSSDKNSESNSTDEDEEIRKGSEDDLLNASVSQTMLSQVADGIPSAASCSIASTSTADTQVPVDKLNYDIKKEQ